MTALQPSHRSALGWRVIEGDCREALLKLPAQSVDAVVTDPPYGLEFMGKEWDRLGATVAEFREQINEDGRVDFHGKGNAPFGGGGQRVRYGASAASMQAWHEAWAREALRVLRPGGLAVAFGGTRTYHRLVSGMEDAGFEIRDMIEWLYGSGFPKHASALKPAHEPIVLARKAGARSEPLNIDACRIEGTKPYREVVNQQTNGWDGAGPWKSSGVGSGESHEGRWPPNVVLDEPAAAMLDEQSGVLVSGEGAVKRASSATHNGNRGAAFGVESRPDGAPMLSYGDSGGASRFFYVAKPDSAERNVGLTGRNPHPTVKPVELMRWLIRLVTPEGGTVLDPFTGSGTTGIAAMREQRSFIGIEREAEYVAVARARIIGDAPLLNLGAEVAA